MTDLQSISIKQTRDQLSQLVEEVAIAKKKFIITKFGKPKAIMAPVLAEASQKKKTTALESTFGIWKDRKDIKNSATWVTQIRHRWSTRLR